MSEHPHECDPGHECEPEEVCAGLMVTLYLDLIRPMCPNFEDRKLRKLMQQHAESDCLAHGFCGDHGGGPTVQ